MLRFPDPPLTDGVITLRAKAVRDVDALVEACQDPAISRWTRVPRPYGPQDALGWLAASELELAAGRAINWLAWDADGRLLASVAVQDIDRERGIGEIGYWVAAAARGRGVATRAVRLVRDWAVAELGLRTLEIIVHEDNAPSHRVARAAGFRPDGERQVPPREGLPPGRYVIHTWRASRD